jgi:hypothetical protein
VTGICLGLTGLPVHHILPRLLRRRTRGDLDSTAAIYGALAGAFQPHTIPTGWTDRINQYCNRLLRDVVEQLDQIRSSAR